jgi:Tol biopolymer transport system component
MVDRTGIGRALPGLAPAYYQNPTFSPDGRRLALMTTGSIIDIWVYDFGRSSMTRLTTEGSSQYPVWSSDGKRIIYRATRSGSRNLFWKSVDDTGPEERLTTSEHNQTPGSSLANGAALVFEELNPQTHTDIWVLPLVGPRTPYAILRDPFDELQPRFSPDGHWLAYVSARSGRQEVYAQSYPQPERRWQISTDGGGDPTWSRDGRELFYRNGRKMMSVRVREHTSFAPSSARVLFESRYIVGEPTTDFDVHPDGDRFVMIQPASIEPPVDHVNVVLNWFVELNRRVPAPK